MTESRTIHSTYKGYQVALKETTTALKQTTTSVDTRYSYKISHDKLPIEILSTKLWDDKLECVAMIVSLIDQHITRTQQKEKAS